MRKIRVLFAAALGLMATMGQSCVPDPGGIVRSGLAGIWIGTQDCQSPMISIVPANAQCGPSVNETSTNTLHEVILDETGRPLLVHLPLPIPSAFGGIPYPAESWPDIALGDTDVSLADVGESMATDLTSSQSGTTQSVHAIVTLQSRTTYASAVHLVYDIQTTSTVNQTGQQPYIAMLSGTITFDYTLNVGGNLDYVRTYTFTQDIPSAYQQVTSCPISAISVTRSCQGTLLRVP